MCCVQAAINCRDVFANTLCVPVHVSVDTCVCLYMCVRLCVCLCVTDNSGERNTCHADIGQNSGKLCAMTLP
jgi:hypothetical protein